MSNYDLDDDQVRRVLNGLATTDEHDAFFRALESQLRTREPDREYVVIDSAGDLWRWNDPNHMWECSGCGLLGWQALIKEYGPVKVYGEIREET